MTRIRRDADVAEAGAPAVAPAEPPARRTVPTVPAGTPADPEREAVVARLFDRQYTSMLRLATLLGAEDPENIVAEAFYEIYRKWRKLRKTDSAEAYLRSVVCNLTRMQIRHLQVARRHVEAPGDPVASAETDALLRDDQHALIAALRGLPPRQREALVLRHWMGLRESEIASTMGISCGSVKTHTARGLAALTEAMEVRR
ncbi:MAG: sigma-70 family RNA polymerase sigma factor [Streptomycetaceae bacterium]|nr:sigma-70 family RNA polymerase sigma factor [Streptomycetaceae bacterium]